jgi:membrane protease subunit (stomatin/prohibitin family)
MPDPIKFVSNYSDHSTDNGFQFEFRCDRCQSGFRTRFMQWSVATAANMADAVGSMLGGVFGRAADMGQRVRSAQWEKAHDQAFETAINEIKPQFIQCPRCNGWVCRTGCWNEKKGLCKNCAPDLGVEMAAAQSSRSVEEVWAHAKMAEEDKNLTESDWREGIKASCPKCEAPLEGNVKFCPKCGANVKQKAFCTSCGKPMEPGTKFCPECGVKQGQ